MQSKISKEYYEKFGAIPYFLVMGMENEDLEKLMARCLEKNKSIEDIVVDDEIIY